MSNHLCMKCSIFFSICIFLSTILIAKESPFYMEAGYGISRFNAPMLNESYLESNSKLSQTAQGYQLASGYQFSPSLAMELSWIDLGIVQQTFNSTVLFLVEPKDAVLIAAKGMTIAPVLTWDINSILSLNGILGCSALEVKQAFFPSFETPVPSYNSGFPKTETNLFGGIGIRGKMTESFFISAKWQRFKVSDTNVDTYFAFGKIIF